MKFIHAADLHIGRSRKLPGYHERQDLMTASIFKLAETRADGLVLLAGDIFDRLDLLPRERDTFVRHLCRADAAGITTVLINGNHDMIDEQDGGYTHLRILQALVAEKRLKNTYVVETNPASFVLKEYGLAVIAVPSYYRKTKEVNAIVGHHLKQLKTNLPVVALVHETVYGSHNDYGKRFGIDIGGEDHCVKLDHKLPVTYWALGDIHAPQWIDGCRHAWYSGAPIQHDFGDTGKRGVLIVDTAKPEKPDLIELPDVKKLITIKVADRDTHVSIPDDAIVRVEGNRAKIASMNLPANVVATKPTVEGDIKTTIESLKSDDCLAGLEEVLAELGVTGEDSKFLVEEAERMRG